MNEFVKKLSKEVNETLSEICVNNGKILRRAYECIHFMENVFERLKEYIKTYEFKNEEEEIEFFKEYKPKLFCYLIFYRKIYNIEMFRPKGGIETQKTYLKNELQRINDYFHKNKDFYHYYSSNSVHLDQVYFLRGKPRITLNLECFYFERDPKFSTNCDFKVAKIIANDMIESYINKELYLLENPPAEGKDYIDTILPKTRLTWTGSKIDLVTLIYGLKHSKCLNNVDISLNKIALYFEHIFNIDLGNNISRDFYDLRIRKNKKNFFDRLRDDLDDYIDELDE